MDDLYDPYEGLTEEEILEKMPPYFNMKRKQKKRYFKNLTKEYIWKCKY